MKKGKALSAVYSGFGVFTASRPRLCFAAHMFKEAAIADARNYQREGVETEICPVEIRRVLIQELPAQPKRKKAK